MSAFSSLSAANAVTADLLEAVAATAAYRELIDRLRDASASPRRAARAVNAELVMLYWSIGRDILEQQRCGGWGDDVVGRIAHDLALDTGSARGFSRRNLFYMRRFAALWPECEKVQTASAQVGWSHHQVLIDAFSEDPGLYARYAAQADRHRWSVRYLTSRPICPSSPSSTRCARGSSIASRGARRSSRRGAPRGDDAAMACRLPLKTDPPSESEPAYHLLLDADEVPQAAHALRLLISDEAHEPGIRRLAREVLAELERGPGERDILTVTLAPQQMKITHSAVRLLLNDLQRGQADEHTMRAIEIE
jgi:hypothetical protein